MSASAQSIARDPESLVGRVLDGRYRVVRVLGEGGMGSVYVAEHVTLQKPVAIKVVRVSATANEQSVAIRLAREAIATARLEHPHIASSIDYGTLPEGGAYLVMQLARGTSLRRLLSGGERMPWPRACEIAAQIADALTATRAAGITHRDVKPDNILVEVRDDGRDLATLLDFGIAQVSAGSADRASFEPAQVDRVITTSGTVMGTPGYMAPEQAVGDTVDGRADLYALGVVLWECIAGRELWNGTDLSALVARQMSERAPLLRSLGVDASIPEPLDELIQRLTQRSPAQRIEHPAQVRDTLRRLLRQYGAIAERTTAPSRAVGRSEPELYDAESPGRARRSLVSGDAPHRNRARRRATPRIGIALWSSALAAAALYLAARTFLPLSHAEAHDSSSESVGSQPSASADPALAADGTAALSSPLLPPATGPMSGCASGFNGEPVLCHGASVDLQAVNDGGPSSAPPETITHKVSPRRVRPARKPAAVALGAAPATTQQAEVPAIASGATKIAPQTAGPSPDSALPTQTGSAPAAAERAAGDSIKAAPEPAQPAPNTPGA